MITPVEVGLGGFLAFVIGFFWYGPIFGERWCAAQGIKMDKDCSGKNMPAGKMLLTLVGWLAAAAVFGWLLHAIPHFSPWFPFGLATVIWLAFKLPGIIASVIWAERDKNLIWIEGGYTLAAMNAIALVYFFI